MKQTLYFGGPILTMDLDNPRAEAILTEEERIAAVGGLDQLSQLAPEACRVDLQGCTLMPGFVDGHSHLAGVGILRLKCSLNGCTGFDEMLQRIRRFREERALTHGETIVCPGYDLALLKEHAHPTAAVLDSLGFDNPIICVHQSAHMCVCSTAAMQACHVDENTPIPAGGHAPRDEGGRLTGLFEEQAQSLFSALQQYSDDQVAQAILDGQEEYLRRGVTTIQEGSSYGPDRLALYEKLSEEGKLTADVVVYLTSRPEQAAFWREAIVRRGNREWRNHLKIGGVKMVLDGSPQARTAWMRKPYEGGDPGYCGYPILTDVRVREMLDAAIDHDLQPLAHCNGDAAAEQFLSAWEQAIAQKGKGAHLRPVMIHAQTVGYDQLDRMAAVGMMPSFFIGHCFFWGDVHLQNFGPERGSRISPVGAAMARGLPYSFHQDSPVTMPDMLHTVWCAVNRQTRSGVCVGPENRIGVYDALIGVTRGAAYSYFEEDARGVLKPGAAADLVILDRDPTAVPPMEIRDIQVLRTIKDGRIVFDKACG